MDGGLPIQHTGWEVNDEDIAEDDVIDDKDVIDDNDSFTSPPTVPRRRVPAYVAAPVVLGCALLGYAISLAIPLSPTSDTAMVNPAAAEARHLATSPAPRVEGSATAAAAQAAAAKGQPADPAQPNSPEAPSDLAVAPSNPAQGPAIASPDTPASPSQPLSVSKPAAAAATTIRTGSVEPAPNAAEIPAATRAELQSSPAEPSASAKRAREARHKRIRRYYVRRRPAAPQPAGPAEALWSLMTK